MPGADPDIVAPLAKRVGKLYDKILLKTKVTAVEAEPGGPAGHLRGRGRVEDRALRRDAGLGRPAAERQAASAPRPRASRRTSAASSPSTARCAPTCHHIFAIGDIVGQPMLAHKASHEGKVAAEVASGHKSAFDAKAIPSVAYTDPEVAWVGPTETELKAKGVKYGKAVFPWAASGRSLSLGPRRGPDQDAVGRGDPAPDRLRHRRAERGRPHLRGGAGDRDGLRRPRTSASPSIRTRRCPRPSPCRPRPSPGR